VLQKAYNDKQGVTAKFNLNLLVRMNRELGANFNVSQFEHHAFYNREKSRIEMHLASLKRQRVRVCGETIDFRAGETSTPGTATRILPPRSGPLPAAAAGRR